jgi:hypothetical protein
MCLTFNVPTLNLISCPITSIEKQICKPSLILQFIFSFEVLKGDRWTSLVDVRSRMSARLIFLAVHEKMRTLIEFLDELQSSSVFF